MKTKTLSLFVTGALIATGAYFLGTRQQAPISAEDSTGRTRSITSAELRNLREILNDPNPITFQKGYLNFLENLTAGQAPDAAKTIWSTPGELAEVKERQKLFSYAWGALDGEATVDFIMNNKSVAKVPALAQAFAGWASNDPQAARTWIESRMKPSERLLYNWALVDGWSRHDPDSATDYVLSLGNLPGTDRFIRSIALEQVRRNPEMATTWASSLPEGSMKTTAVSEIAQSWSRVEPADATAWAVGLSNTGEMKRAVTTSVTQWTRVDPSGAGSYLEELIPSPARDQALAAHVNVLANDNLAASSEWAQQIQDTRLREESLREIAEEWSDRDSKAVLAWLPQSGLSEKEIATLTNEIDRR